MKYRIDVLKQVENIVKVEGWVLPNNPLENPSFLLYDKLKNIVPIKLVKTKREDIEQVFLDNKYTNLNLGFNITFDYKDDEKYTLYIKTKERTVKEIIDKKYIDIFNSTNFKKHQKFLSYFKMNTFRRAFEFLLKKGPSPFIKKTIAKIKNIKEDSEYDMWFRKVRISDEELLEQERNYKSNFKFLPKFSIVIPIFDTKKEFLIALFDSIFNQSYKEFEVCIVDATDYNNSKNNPKEVLLGVETKFSNVKIKYLDKNISISHNTNEAIKLATNDYIILCDHDDILERNALYEIAKVLNDNKYIEFIYSDEDKIDKNGYVYFEPNFKPDFNIDLLLSCNYICHLTCIKRSLLEKIKCGDYIYERNEYNGAQDYDLYLRIVTILLNENNLDKIFHIPMVLYHWRVHLLSTANETDSKMYAITSGKNALEDFYKNNVEKFPYIDHVENAYNFGFYKTVFKKFINEPLLNIVIPNKDHILDLEKTINSVSSGTYKNIKFVIVENNSINKETFEYYDKLKNRKDINIDVLYYKGIFNYSLINNFAVDNINSEYILFLNNDVEMIKENSIDEMMHYIIRDDVGGVGAKLLYKDDTIQHAGVVVGFGGIAGHTFIGAYDKATTYMNRSMTVCDYSAVTAACLMVKRSIFIKANKFDEKFVVAFNDIDLCMKIRELKKLIVYNPYSKFYHFESKTRGLEDTKEKVKRFNKEVARFAIKWKDILENGDPYYNKNLTLRKSDFSLKNLDMEKIGEPYPLNNEIKRIMRGLIIERDINHNSKL